MLAFSKPVLAVFNVIWLPKMFKKMVKMLLSTKGLNIPFELYFRGMK